MCTRKNRLCLTISFFLLSTLFLNCIITKNGASHEPPVPEPALKAILVSVNGPADESELRQLLSETGHFRLLRSQGVKDSYEITSNGFVSYDKGGALLTVYNLLSTLSTCVLPVYESHVVYLRTEIKSSRPNSKIEKFETEFDFSAICWWPVLPLTVFERFAIKDNVMVVKTKLVERLARRLLEKAREDKLL